MPCRGAAALLRRDGALVRRHDELRTVGQKLGHFLKLPLAELLTPVIGLMKGLTDPVVGLLMGQTAENLAWNSVSAASRWTNSPSKAI
jgi:hypothetical protein